MSPNELGEGVHVAKWTTARRVVKTLNMADCRRGYERDNALADFRNERVRCQMSEPEKY